jgi:hypothetical protein
MSSQWRHSLCMGCWDERNPGCVAHALREEFRDEKPEKCCGCGRMHGSGIYLREDPALMQCKGVHEEGAA